MTVDSVSGSAAAQSAPAPKAPEKSEPKEESSTVLEQQGSNSEARASEEGKTTIAEA